MADSSATKRSRVDDDEVTPSSKRYRNSEWPLPSTATPQRPSKFLEGSMNDRVSKKPPTPFIEQERPLSMITNHSDAPRQSGIFKFGRSITAGFNPANWKIWSKTQPAVRDERTEQQRLWDAQKEMADRKYEELRRSGYIPVSTKTTPKRAKHDSAIYMSNGPITPPRHSVSAASSPVGAQSKHPSHMKKTFGSKKSSLSNMKKAFGESATSLRGGVTKSVKRISSRKDLTKQQKLQEKLSKAEYNTEKYRRQLAELMDESDSAAPTPTPITVAPPPAPPRFVPILSSLPSERLLAGYISDDGEEDELEQDTNIGRAVSVSRSNAPVRKTSIPQLQKEIEEKKRQLTPIRSRIHIITEGGDVPPIPRLPEMYKDSKVAEPQKGLPRDTESFVWDRDTF
ncbi:hypothetical protein GLAREA_03864 [Glarea lozoyensis ATCC 20868]|uniref:Uncharacterized protein n=1 Tax=Glarea lozoyensis (strain ATCC 20868 / MF5171) TaxID=1116229 RepID=S3CX24_GLAL2|nr:uncharacterized protein GLAREA_03864 [Glarea lozoyensis ATCC 20868]EPE30897.1 hypothetical protein GLAREA_03864 [Glarea lozoyensis ATCC 20868]